VTDLLTNLANKYGSDKGEKSYANNFTKIYDSYLSDRRNDVKKVLEIGVGNGGSLRMWCEYFPNAIIYGIDINPGFLFSEDRIITALVDQSNREGLKKFAEENGPFDLILDDGSHNVIHQQISLGLLFPYLEDGGYYIVEDLHTSFGWGGIDWGLEANHPNVTYNVLDRFIKSNYTSIDSPYIIDEEKSFIENNVSHIAFFETRPQPKERITSVIKKGKGRVLPREIDIVIISWAKNDVLLGITHQTLDTLLESENPSRIKFNIFVVETNKDVVYNYPSTKTLYPEPPYGYNKYCNFGRKAGKAPYVCLCNNDLIFHKGWATEIIKAFDENPEVLSASPFCPRWHVRQWKMKPNTGNIPERNSGKGVMGHCIFQQRKIYDIIGDLDEQFIHWCCDWDYAATIKKYGVNNYLVTSSLVEHVKGSKTFFESVKSDPNIDRRQELTIGQISIYNKKWNS